MSETPPLSGIRVVDFTMNLPGPYATMMLRALGAEVIKIEPPRGDTARTFPRMFEILNAGKQSVVLDLKAPGASDALESVLSAADVVVEGFRPGVMQRLGVGPRTLTERFPRLVYCSISGFGQSGPYRDHPGHDLNFQALTGVCHMLRDANDRPLGGAIPVGDLSAAMTAVTAILAALVRRGRTGTGQVLDIAMVDALLSWAYVWTEGLTPSDTGLDAAAEPTSAALRRAAGSLPAPLAQVVAGIADGIAGPRGRATLRAVGSRLALSKRVRSLKRLRLHTLPHYTVYRTRDDRYLSIGIVDEDKFWRGLCEVLELRAVAPIPLWGRFVAAAPLRKLVGNKIAKRSLQHWMDAMTRAQIPAAPVLTVEEALRDPQLRHRIPTRAPVQGPWSVGQPVEAPPPGLGEHTDRWLADDPT